MATIVTRSGKGSALTHTEMDSNVTNLNTDKPDVVGTPATANVATWDASDDLEDSGYSFSGLVGDLAITKTEFDILDGATVTTVELNLLDGVTSTTAELNILDGVTSTTAELNILDGVTSTTAELNILTSVTSTTAEINLLDGVTGTIWTSTNDGAGSGLDADTFDGKQLVKDWGTVTGATPIDLSVGDFHVVECGANLTLTFSSSNTNDKASIAIHNNGGYTITVAGIDNNSPTLTVDTNVQDILGLIKSHGKITMVGAILNQVAV